MLYKRRDVFPTGKTSDLQEQPGQRAALLDKRIGQRRQFAEIRLRKRGHWSDVQYPNVGIGFASIIGHLRHVQPGQSRHGNQRYGLRRRQAPVRASL